MVDQNEGAPANVPPSEAKALVEGEYTLLDVRRVFKQDCALRAAVQRCPQLPRQAAAARAGERRSGGPRPLQLPPANVAPIMCPSPAVSACKSVYTRLAHWLRCLCLPQTQDP